MSNLNFTQTIRVFLKPSNLIMLFMGFSAGIPILLIFSSLSLWLREAGIERSAVTFFSWAALGYSFKFIWAPLVDKLPLPGLTKKLGRRRSWLLVSQVFIIFGILGMALTDPSRGGNALTMMAVFAVLLGFSSATQDIVIDAYRIESDTKDMQAILSSTYIAGYRIGMIVAGAGALFLASRLGSIPGSYSFNAWSWTYIFMALVMGIGIVTTIVAPEPEVYREKDKEFSTEDNLKFFGLFLLIVILFVTCFKLTGPLSDSLGKALQEFLGSSFSAFLGETVRMLSSIFVVFLGAKLLLKTKIVNKKLLEETYIAPVTDFFNRYGQAAAILLLSLVGLYRISDIVLGVISNVFYQDLGFTKVEIASIVKTFGLIMTLVGGFLGGILTVKFGTQKILLWGAILAAGTNLLFMALATMGNNLPMLYLVISADNLAAGMASAAFVAFLSSLTNISFTAVQYAIFTSLMTLLPKVLGGYSGSIVDSIGYQKFFLFTTLIGLPVIFLVHIAGKKLEARK